jgi:hypothetical protein
MYGKYAEANTDIDCQRYTTDAHCHLVWVAKQCRFAYIPMANNEKTPVTPIFFKLASKDRYSLFVHHICQNRLQIPFWTADIFKNVFFLEE